MRDKEILALLVSLYNSLVCSLDASNRITMADSRTVSSSVSFAEKSLLVPSTVDINNPEFSRSNEDLIPTADDKLKLCWTGDFISLKSFVGVKC